MAFEIDQAGVGDGNTAVFRVDSEGAGQVLRGDGVGDGGALGVGGCHGDAGQRACEGGLADAARTGQFDEGRGLVVSLVSPSPLAASASSPSSSSSSGASAASSASTVAAALALSSAMVCESWTSSVDRSA